MNSLVEVRRAALACLRPPPRLPLSRWVEENIRLPGGLAAVPGPMKLWRFQKDIADSVGDPSVEKISVLKSARVGFSSILSSVAAFHICCDQAPILIVLPVQIDCRDFMAHDFEKICEASPALAGKLNPPSRTPDERSTILSRHFPNGSLRIIPARSARGLRRVTAKILLCDEIDAWELTAEGDPLALAEKRTLSFPDRKIVCGSSPTDETSVIVRLYEQSDQRIFEVPCPHCGARFEIGWKDIRWPTNDPALAYCACPSCEGVIEERQKAAMVEAGKWRATKPEVRNHHGYKLNSLISLMPNATWPKLAEEFLTAKRDADTLRVFVNAVLGEPWRDGGDEVEEGDLASRVEDFSLQAIPREILAITCGADVQDDRIEVCFLGWSKDGVPWVLEHRQLWGRPPDTEDECWRDFDSLLRSRFAHPAGGVLRIDGCCVDGGDGGHFDTVSRFCAPRLSRKVMCIKGVPNFGRPMIQASKSRRQGARLFLVAVDVVKSSLFARLARPGAIRFSSSLPAEYFTQLTSEVRRVRYRAGKPIVRFERKPGCAAEALDATGYAIAARAALQLNLDQREAELAQPTPPERKPDVFRSQWMSR